MKILSVVGARPNFMKIAPIIRAVGEHNRAAPDRERIDHVLVHTGQHYDRKMSGVFFEDLGLPDPDVCLGVGSGSHAVQTAETMKRFEEALLNHKPDCVVLVGDVNSTVACALTASKISYNGLPGSAGSRPLVAHVEAGLRSFDRDMPEEINRIVTDHLSDLLFVTEQSGVDNLLREGTGEGGIFFVGNTMIDTLLACRERAGSSPILDTLGLSPGGFALATLHRPANVDSPEKFREILGALDEISRSLAVVIPLHPRTLGRLRETPEGRLAILGGGQGARRDRVNAIGPLSYLDFVCLMANSRIVLTDSGGVQEETTCLGVPCVTVRENTERPVTLTEGTNALAGTSREGIIRVFKRQMNKKFDCAAPRLWDGKAAERIVKVLGEKAAHINHQSKLSS
ncbi:MAG: UDP-N-acetylglucosamine 2-epimerase (non-hydrolyzing) [Syntrophaceae bacterium]